MSGLGDVQVIISGATLLALVTGVWKVSSDLSSMRTMMANKVDVALLGERLKNLRDDVNALWTMARERGEVLPRNHKHE